MSDIKKLKKLYSEYQKIKGMSEGGKTEKPHNKENLQELKISFNKFIDEEGGKKYSDGGEVEDDSTLSDLKRKFQEAFKSPTPPKPKEETEEDKFNRIREQNQERSMGKRSSLMSMDPEIKGYSDGEEVEGNDQSLSPDEFDQHIQTLRDKGYIVHDVNGDEQKITVSPRKPASEVALNDENPDDKALEQQYQNEDFEAGEKSDKPVSKEELKDEEVKKEIDDELASEENKESEKQMEDQKSEEPKEEVENKDEEEKPEQSAASRLVASSQEPESSSGDLEKAQKERDLNNAMAQVQRGAAIAGAGLAHANVDPSLTLNSIDKQQALAGMPVQKYQEKIANQQNDPKSQMSQVVRGYLKNKGMQISDNASAADLFKVAPFLQKDQALQMSLQKTLMGLQVKQSEGEKARQAADERNQRSTDATKAAATIRADAIKAGQQNTNQRQAQRLSGQLVNRIQMDPIIKPSLQNMASLQKSKAIIENKNVPMTPQLLSDAEQDISQALTLRGMGATEGKIKRTEIMTIGRKLAEARQKYLNEPGIDLRKEEPELVNTIYNMNRALLSDYDTTIKQRKNDLAKEYEAGYGDNPLLSKTIDQYKQGTSSAPNNQDQKAMQHYQTMPQGPDKDVLGQILKNKGLM